MRDAWQRKMSHESQYRTSRREAREMTAPKFDALAFVMRMEEGEEMTAEEVIDGMAHLIADGTAWKLQGSYGRFADSMIRSGWIDTDGNVLAYPEAEN